MYTGKTEWAWLITLQRSGHIVIWKAQAPFTKLEFSAFHDLKLTDPSVLKIHPCATGVLFYIQCQLNSIDTKNNIFKAINCSCLLVPTAVYSTVGSCRGTKRRPQLANSWAPFNPMKISCLSTTSKWVFPTTISSFQRPRAMRSSPLLSSTMEMNFDAPMSSTPCRPDYSYQVLDRVAILATARWTIIIHLSPYQV